jgi:hypothetical protein
MSTPMSCTVRSMLLVTLVPVALAAQPRQWTIHADPSLSGVAARLSSIDAESFARSLSAAGLAPPERVEITLVANDDPRARATPSWVVAQASGVHAITIYPQRIGSYPYDSLESVVLHELVHLALNARADERSLPRWFHEGVAVSVEAGWGIGSQARLLLAAARDPGLDDLASLFASEAIPETTTAYLLSAALVEDVRRRHGLAVPGAIAARVGAGESFEDAFAAETGESVDEAAARAWRVYRGLRWLPVVTSPSGVWSGILALAVLAFVARQRRRRHQRRLWEDAEKEPTESGSAAAQEE